MQPDILIPQSIAPVQLQKVNVARALPGVRLRFGQTPQHRLPRLQRVQRSAYQRPADRFDPIACGFVHILGFVFQPGEEAFAQGGERFGNAGQGAGETVFVNLQALFAVLSAGFGFGYDLNGAKVLPRGLEVEAGKAGA